MGDDIDALNEYGEQVDMLAAELTRLRAVAEAAEQVVSTLELHGMSVAGDDLLVEALRAWKEGR